MGNNLIALLLVIFEILVITWFLRAFKLGKECDEEYAQWYEEMHRRDEQNGDRNSNKADDEVHKNC